MIIRDHQQVTREFATLIQVPQLSHPQTCDTPTGSSTGQTIQTLQARLPISTKAKAFHSAL